LIPSPRSPMRNRCCARGTSTVTAAVDDLRDLYFASIFSRTSAMRSRCPVRVICSSEEGWCGLGIRILISRSGDPSHS
jgi:hypothetical protein